MCNEKSEQSSSNAIKTFFDFERMLQHRCVTQNSIFLLKLYLKYLLALFDNIVLNVVSTHRPYKQHGIVVVVVVAAAVAVV